MRSEPHLTSQLPLQLFFLQKQPRLFGGPLCLRGCLDGVPKLFRFPSISKQAVPAAQTPGFVFVISETPGRKRSQMGTEPVKQHFGDKLPIVDGFATFCCSSEGLHLAVRQSFAACGAPVCQARAPRHQERWNGKMGEAT